MRKCVLALDQGTTSSRAMVFDHAGQVLGTAQQEFPQILPSPGVVEHDPEAIWESQLAVACQAAQRAGIQPDEIAAVGIANQRETTILWERATGRPVSNAIVWQSRVSAPICERLKAAGHEALFRRKTGLVLDPYFSGTKITYLLEREEGLRRRAERGEICFGTVDSWLLWRLTGGRCHATDYSNASRTLLMDLETLQWDDKLLELLGVPRPMLPQLRGSSEVYGTCQPEWLGAEVPIASAAGDQQAATFGQACFQPGEAKNTYGTGCFLLLNTGRRPIQSQHSLLTTLGWVVGGQATYCLEGSIFIGGAAIQWLRDGLRLIEKAADVETLARSVPDAGGVFFVPALVGLGAPHWDPYARGTIIGITRGTTRGHLARAALEAIALQTRDVLEAMQNDAGERLQTLKVDGGAVVNDLLLQLQADVLGVPVERPRVIETTALGAAYLAGLAVEFWKDLDELRGHWALDRRFLPQVSQTDRDTHYGRWQRAVGRAMKWEQADHE